MCSSHSTGCERTCEFRSKISAHFGSASLKLRKVPAVPWQDPLARKTESPFRNVSTRKRSGDCRVWNRSILFRPFWQETSGTDDSAGRKKYSTPLLVGDASLSIAGLGHCGLMCCPTLQLPLPFVRRSRWGRFERISSPWRSACCDSQHGGGIEPEDVGGLWMRR